jgi:hypothetical protein
MAIYLVGTGIYPVGTGIYAVGIGVFPVGKGKKSEGTVKFLLRWGWHL